jgi:RND superfamily putative drug exporter
VATFLYKIGRMSFRRRHFVALLWVALLTLAGVGAASAPAAGNSSFSIPGTEAQKAFDLLEQRFPGTSADGATARVVFKAPSGEKMTDPGNKATVQETVKELSDGSEVVRVTDPYQAKAVSKDRYGRVRAGVVQGLRHGAGGLLPRRTGGLRAGRAQGRADRRDRR